MASLHAYKRGIGYWGLMFSAISAMIGSGWLFSALYVGRIAGPSSIIAWIFGGFLVMLVALTYAEISTMLPITGGSTRFPQLTHGTFVSLFFGWITWFNLMTAPAIEVQAMLQYAANYWPCLLKVSQGQVSVHGLSAYGYTIATGMMVSFSLINVYSIRFISRINNIFSFWKLIIPILTATVLLLVSFHPHNFNNVAYGGFFPHGLKGVFIALATGGILFAFNGFKQAAEMAGEATNPKRALPIAIVGSVGITLIIFLLLEFAFLYSLTPGNLSHGWHHIALQDNNSPLTSIAVQDHLKDLLPLLYIGAIISPLAAGLMYCGSASRSLYAMSKNGYIPSFFKHLSAEGNPMYAIGLNFIVGMCMFAPLPGWQSMMAFLTSLMAITYAIAPICLLALRRQVPDFERPFRLPFATLWCTLAFYVCTLLVYWSGWDIIFKTDIGIIIGFVVLFLYQTFGKNPRKVKLDWQAGIWIWPYFIGLSVVSYFGNYGGGVGIFNDWQAAVLLAILAVICLYIATRFALPAKRVTLTLSKLNLKRYDLMEGG